MTFREQEENNDSRAERNFCGTERTGSQSISQAISQSINQSINNQRPGGTLTALGYQQILSIHPAKNLRNYPNCTYFFTMACLLGTVISQFRAGQA
jgi:hypothetical protein